MNDKIKHIFSKFEAINNKCQKYRFLSFFDKWHLFIHKKFLHKFFVHKKDSNCLSSLLVIMMILLFMPTLNQQELEQPISSITDFSIKHIFFIFIFFIIFFSFLIDVTRMVFKDIYISLSYKKELDILYQYIKQYQDNTFVQDENKTRTIFELLSLHHQMRCVDLNHSKSFVLLYETINNLVNLNKRENKNIKIFNSKFNQIYKHNIYTDEQDIIDIFSQPHLDLSFILHYIDFDLAIVQKCIAHIIFTVDNLNSIKNNIDYFDHNQIKNLFKYSKKEQFNEQTIIILQSIIGFEDTTNIIYNNSSQINHENNEKLMTLKMNG